MFKNTPGAKNFLWASLWPSAKEEQAAFLALRIRVLAGEKTGFERLIPWIYVLAAALVLVLTGFGAILLKQKPQSSPAASGIEAPKPIIPAGREQVIELEGFDRKKFLDEWKKLFTLQLLPREFLYVKIFDKNLQLLKNQGE